MGNLNRDVRADKILKARCRCRKFVRSSRQLSQGVVAGGGVALLRARGALDNIKGANADQEAGISIVWRACEEPLRAIAYNAGAEPSVVVNAVAHGEGNYGYNAANDTFGDLVEQGVIDPTKVTRTALINAASIAGMLLTTECSINTIPEDKPAQHMHPDMGMM